MSHLFPQQKEYTFLCRDNMNAQYKIHQLPDAYVFIQTYQNFIHPLAVRIDPFYTR